MAMAGKACFPANALVPGRTDYTHSFWGLVCSFEHSDCHLIMTSLFNFNLFTGV